MTRQPTEYVILTQYEAECLGEPSYAPGPFPASNKLGWREVKAIGQRADAIAPKLAPYSVAVPEYGFAFLQTTPLTGSEEPKTDLEWGWKVAVTNRTDRGVYACADFCLLDAADYPLTRAARGFDAKARGTHIPPHEQRAIQGRSRWTYNHTSTPFPPSRVHRGDFSLFLRHDVSEKLADEQLPAAIALEKLPGVTAVTLPATVRDVTAGGGGRYLVLYLMELQKLAIFDVRLAKVTRFISLPAEEALLAACQDAVIVGLPVQELLVRYSLTSGEKEATVPAPVDKLYSLAMGYASSGPLLVNDGTLVDPTTMKAIPLGDKVRRKRFAEKHAQTRAGGDGRTFGAWRRGVTPSGLFFGMFDGESLYWREEHTSVRHVVPGFGGKVVCTGLGLFTPGLKQIGNRVHRATCIPAYGSIYYLAFTPISSSHGNRRRFGGTLCTVCDQRPLLTLPRMKELIPDVFEDRCPARMSLEKRIHFFPDVNLLVTIPASPDKLVLRELNVTNALEKADIDYLFVTSSPPASGERGETYEYQIEVQSKKGGLRYFLDSAPVGMSLSESGEIRWKIPEEFADNPVVVILSVKDAAEQEIYHAFKIDLH